MKTISALSFNVCFQKTVCPNVFCCAVLLSSSVWWVRFHSKQQTHEPCPQSMKRKTSTIISTWMHQNLRIRRTVLTWILMHDTLLSFELYYIFLLPFLLELSRLIKNNNFVLINVVKINAHPTIDQIDFISFASRKKFDHRVHREGCWYFGWYFEEKCLTISTCDAKS